MNLTTVMKIADEAPEKYATVLRTQVVKINNYPDNQPYLAEELVPILSTMIALSQFKKYDELLAQAWKDLFKGGAAFNKSYISKNLDAGNENFMKYLDIAIHSANPEHMHQVGLGKLRR